MVEASPKLIDLKASFSSRLRPLVPIAEHTLAAGWLNRSYSQVQALVKETGRPFFECCLEVAGIRYEVDNEALARVPEGGPVVVVSNHPFGGADAIILADVLTKLRGDSLLLANYLLERIPEAAPSIIPVDPFGGRQSSTRNLRPIRRALTHLHEGGLLAVFPAGEVSNLDLRARRVCDCTWSTHVASLVRRSGATVVPVHFEGRNSWFFQLTGLVHPMLRTARLPRELRRMRGKTVRLRIGKPIPPNKIPQNGSTRETADFLRLRADVLAESSRIERKQRTRSGEVLPVASLEPVAEPAAPSLIHAEIEALPEEALLVSQDHWRVYITPAAPVPHLINELGRLREITFRQVGEGTGKARDLDHFDDHYQHLFLWDSEASLVAGAYRIAATDVVMAEKGIRSLYTRSLFKFGKEFVERLTPGLELGRSFITARYQRKITSLFLLWRGIFTYVGRNPRYRLLFGPVSISQDYHALSRNLLVKFLRDRLVNQDLARYVSAPNPPQKLKLHHLQKQQVSSSLRDIEDVSALISEIEEDGKGIPVLLKHYVRMSAALLSFNVDKDFSGVIDGLILVDLSLTDDRLLRRYMGDTGLKRFRAYHAALEAETAADQ